MAVQRFGDTARRRVRALQVGLAVGLLLLAALAVLAKGSTGPFMQWPVLLLVLAGALLIERQHRGALPSAVRARVAGKAPGEAPRPGRARRLWGWLQGLISDGVVHGHGEGERCNDLCRRTRPVDEPAQEGAPSLVTALGPGRVPARACRSARLGQRGAARTRSARSSGPRVNS